MDEGYGKRGSATTRCTRLPVWSEGARFRDLAGSVGARVLAAPEGMLGDRPMDQACSLQARLRLGE